ncbi:hypothetical protein BDV11DRAFT_173504 [Aspergillus similis]
MPPRRRQKGGVCELLNCDDAADSALNRSLVNQVKLNPVDQGYTPRRNVAEAPTRRVQDILSQRIKEPQPEGIPPETFTAQLVLNPATSKDVTIHFDMDVTDDIGALLEEFSRLKRLGDYRVAARYFDDNLRGYTDIILVTIEYADMLVEQGAYHELAEFLRPHNDVLGHPIWGDASRTSREHPECLYQANLQLIDAFASMHRNGKMERAKERVRSIARLMGPLFKHSPTAASLDSAEVQIFRYALKILSIIEKETDLIPEIDFDHWANSGHLYRPLLAMGQVWDVRDLVCALIESEGAKNAWDIMFLANIHSPNAFSNLLDDWNMGQYDESTYLAILDILVQTSQSLSSFTFTEPTEQDLTTAERCLEHARSVARCLKESNPELIHCRSYLAWVLAETRLRRKRNTADLDLTAHLSAYPGLTIRTSTLPIYLPVRSENPTWCPPGCHQNFARTSDDELLEAAIETAHARKDYATEVACLAELIYRSAGGPEAQGQRFSRMHDLQAREQKDILGCQHTCLARFLTTSTDQDRQALLSNIRDLQHRSPNKKQLTVSLTGWCLHIMERALALHSSGTAASAWPTIDVDPWLLDLPTYIKDQLSDRGMKEAYGLNTRLVDSFRRRERLGRDKERLQSRARDLSLEPRTNVPDLQKTTSYERVRPRDYANVTVVSGQHRPTVERSESKKLPAIGLENKVNHSSSKTDDENDLESALVPVSFTSVNKQGRKKSPPAPASTESSAMCLTRRTTVGISEGSDSEQG